MHMLYTTLRMAPLDLDVCTLCNPSSRTSHIHGALPYNPNEELAQIAKGRSGEAKISTLSWCNLFSRYPDGSPTSLFQSLYLTQADGRLITDIATDLHTFCDSDRQPPNSHSDYFRRKSCDHGY